MDSVADELLKLKSLLDAGALTESEFNQQKAAILAGNTRQPVKPLKVRKPVDYDQVAKRVMLVSAIVGGLSLIAPFLSTWVGLSFVGVICIVIFFGAAAYRTRATQYEFVGKANPFIEAGIAVVAMWLSTFLVRTQIYTIAASNENSFWKYIIGMYFGLAVVAGLLVLIERVISFQRVTTIFFCSIIYTSLIVVFINTTMRVQLYGHNIIDDPQVIAEDAAFIFVALFAARYYYAIHMQRMSKSAAETAGHDALSPSA